MPRFWELGAGPATAQEFAVLAAMTIAMSARNWVEDLHVARAFSDAQAPGLNRRLRNRAYEVLLALQLVDRSGAADPLAGFLACQAELDGHRGHGTAPDAALRGAIRKAVRDFAEAEQLTASAARELERAAVAGAADTYRCLQTIDQQTSAMQISYLASLIPRNWELPAIDPHLDRIFASQTHANTASAPAR
jgi:hypothetical protein